MEFRKVPDMGIEQIHRNNKYLTLIMAIMYVFFTIGNVMELTMSKESSRTATIFTMLLGVAMLCVNLYMFRFRRDSKRFILVSFSGFTIVYLTAMIFSMATIYAYVFPVLIIVCTYMNQKLSFYAVLFTIVINLMNIVKSVILNGGMDDELSKIVSVQIITVVLACVGTYLITIIMAEGMARNIKMTKDQIKIVDNATCITEEMHSNFRELKEELDDLSRNVHENTTSIGSISEGIRYTALEISRQLEQTEKIKNDMEDTTDRAANIYDETRGIVETLQGGMHDLEALEEQSGVVNTHIDNTTERLTELTSQVEEVENIANSIIGISSQTNLLSLNASIEAARAGEAGKGFAVVSEQIRILADETRNASEKITEIIQVLNHISGQTSESLNSSIQSIEQQDELMKSAAGSYENAYQHVQSLNQHVDHIRDRLQDARSANVEISDSVSNLSASSEEVSASTTDVNEFTQKVSGQMDHFVEMISHMDELMNELQKSIME